jgi:hypothetical protein
MLSSDSLIILGLVVAVIAVIVRTEELVTALTNFVQLLGRCLARLRDQLANLLARLKSTPTA